MLVMTFHLIVWSVNVKTPLCYTPVKSKPGSKRVESAMPKQSSSYKFKAFYSYDV